MKTSHIWAKWPKGVTTHRVFVFLQFLANLQDFRNFRGPSSIHRGLPASYLPIIDFEECHIDFQVQLGIGADSSEGRHPGLWGEPGLSKQPALLCPTLLRQNILLTGHRIDPFGCISGLSMRGLHPSSAKERIGDCAKGPLA